MLDTPRPLIEGRTFVEAPRWHENRLWFSDLYTYEVLSVREDGSDLRVEATIPGEPAGIDWLPGPYRANAPRARCRRPPRGDGRRRSGVER